jgi:hypothetical protein
MAKPKKYPEVMELAVGSGVHVQGTKSSVLRAIAGYGARCKPQRDYWCDESLRGDGWVYVGRAADLTDSELPGA